MFFTNLITGVNGQIHLEHNDFRNMVKDISGVFNPTYHGIGVLAISQGLRHSTIEITLDNYFYNCLYGTYTARCNTSIVGVSMDTVQIGVHIRNGNLTQSSVTNCTINAIKYGVDLLNNAGATLMDITDNNLF